MDRNNPIDANTPRDPPLTRNESPPQGQLHDPDDHHKKEQKWRERIDLKLEDNIMEAKEETPIITVNPPPESKPQKLA
jgi:hypothetical protein